MISYRLVAAPAIALLLCTAHARGVIVDHFDAPQSLAVNSSFSADFGTASDAAIFGFERDITLFWDAGPGDITVEVGAGGGSVLDINSEPGTEGTVFVDWDGPDGSSSIDVTGLGGVDITVDITDSSPLNAFGIQIASNAEPIDIELIVITDSANTSIAIVSLPGGIVTPQYYTVLYSDFVADLGSGADFTNVGSGFLAISAPGDTSLQIDFLEAVFVPEPSSLVLGVLGLCALGAFVWPRKR